MRLVDEYRAGVEILDAEIRRLEEWPRLSDGDVSAQKDKISYLRRERENIYRRWQNSSTFGN